MLEPPEDITLPPPVIKQLVHKTAGYVHRNGPSFEAKIKESEGGSQFNFLKDDDVYRPYYLWVLENAEELSLNNTEGTPAAGDGNQGDYEEEEDEFSNEVNAVKELEFTVDLPTITSRDLSVIKLTALFVAENGENYATIIRNRYTDEYSAAQFAFLNPEHSLHSLYTTFIHQYSQILNNAAPKLIDDDKILHSCIIRAKYKMITDAEKKRLQAQETHKQDALLKVDWQDSTVVETITFTDIDTIAELAKPITIRDLQLRSLSQKSKEVTALSLPPAASTTSTTTNGMKIRAFGATRLQRGVANGNLKDKLVECPLTGKKIPEVNFQRHMEILLRDPKYKEEKKNYEAKIQNSNLSTTEVVQNIKSLFKKEQDTVESKKRKVQWDGYASSIKHVKSENRVSKGDVEEYNKRIEAAQYGPKNRE